jgi:hypothetical protein
VCTPCNRVLRQVSILNDRSHEPTEAANNHYTKEGQSFLSSPSHFPPLLQNIFVGSMIDCNPCPVFFLGVAHSLDGPLLGCGLPGFGEYSDETGGFANLAQSLLDGAHPNNRAVESNPETISKTIYLKIVTCHIRLWSPRAW